MAGMFAVVQRSSIVRGMGASRDRSDQKARVNKRTRQSTRATQKIGAPESQTSAANDSVELTAPAPTVWAGWLGILEGLAGVGFGAVITAVDALGYEGTISSSFGYGTAVMFFIIFGFVAIAGWALRKSHPWGRTPVLMLNMFLIPISWYMYSSGRLELAVPTVLVGLTGLVLSFHPKSVEWAATRYGTPR